jgi:GntR family transcriptional regulator
MQGRKTVVRVTVIARTTGAADAAEQERLNLAAGDVVVRVTRIRSKGDRTASYELAVLPLGRFPGLVSDSDMQDDVFVLARDHGLVLGRATELVDIVHVATDVAEHLGVDPDEAVLKLDRIVRTSEGLPIEWRVAFVADS